MPLDRLLIADDEREVVQQLDAIFAANGFRTLGACNGVEAWNLLVRYSDEIAACVIDLQMPPGNFGGTDLVLKIRRALSALVPIVVYSGRGTVSLAHEVTKGGANAFVEKEDGQEHLVNVVARLISEVVRPGQNIPSSLNALAASGDVQWLASRSFKQLEAYVRTEILSNYAPKQLHDLFSTRHHAPSKYVMDKLLELDRFTNETRLSFGDLLDLLTAMSMAQVRKLPSSKTLSRLKDQIVPARNSLEHGRAVDTRGLLVALMASDELLDNLRGAR